MSHKSFTLDALKQTAVKHTKLTVLKTKKGAVVLSQFGARVLGMFPDKELTNTLWNPEKLGTLLAEKNWFIGGERLWLSPERNFYYENPRDFIGHHVPPRMDPGNYQETGEHTFENEFGVFDYMTNDIYEGGHAKRIFKQIDDPYATDLPFVGLEISDTLTLGVADIPMCAWSLSMVYTCGIEHPGTALFPIKKGSTFISYFNKIPDHRAESCGEYVRYRIDASEIYKLAIAPEDMTSNPVKAVYVSPYPHSKKWFCVIKRSTDLPKTQADCVDPAKSNPEGLKGAIQSYNAGPAVNSPYMPFGEIEVQLKKGVTKGNKTTSHGTHELLSYAGDKDEILALAQKALHISSVPEIY